MDWDIYENRLGVSGVSGRDRAISRTQESILRKAENSPALKSVHVNGLEMRLFINTTDVPSEKMFNTLPGELINIGDILLWNEMHWLVTKVDFDDEITRRGHIVQCNRQIRWQNSVTGEIIERWCLATKPYTSNIDKGQVISTSNREYKVQLSYDEESRLVDLDKRFLLEEIGGEPKAYIVTSVDTLTNRYQDIDGGFLIWNLTQTEYHPATDNAELMIANYIKPGTPPPPPPIDLLPCSITGKNSIRLGAYRRYGAVFYDANGDVVVDGSVSPVWTVEPPQGAGASVTWTVENGQLTLSVDENAQLSDTQINLTLADSAGAYAPSSLCVEVSGLL